MRCPTNAASKIAPVEGSVSEAQETRTGTCPTCLSVDVPLSVKGFMRAHDVTHVVAAGGKCPVKMTGKIAPVEGSVTGLDGKKTGTCPVCATPGVHLSIVGDYMRTHVVAVVAVAENNPQPATLVDTGARRDKSTGRVLKVGTGLKEPVTDVADTGVRVGSPRTAEAQRRVEIESVTGTGTVQVPRKVEGKTPLKNGAPRMVTKMVDVPATEDHVREALAYWQAKIVRYNADGSVVSEEARQHKLAMIEEMFRRLRAMSGDAPVMIIDGQARDTAAAYRGPTLVRGRAMDADEVTGPRERRGDKPVRSTFEGPLGRERADRRITTVPEPAPELSASQKRRARRKRCHAAHGATTVKASA